MGEKKFFVVLMLAVLNILLLFLLNIDSPVYIFEFFMLILFALGLFLIILSYMNSRHWFGVTGTIIFSIGLLNTVFVYFFVKSFGLVILTIINAFGFLLSIDDIGSFDRKRKHELRSKSELIEKELPFEEPVKVVTYGAAAKRKARKKKVSKKKAPKKRGRPKKKTTKKKVTKRRAKKK
jgi:hypothetical protein